METRMVQVASNGEQIGAYVAKPDGQGPFPAVVVIMEVWGLVDHIKDVTERFAREGYVGICPDLFHRTNGPGPIKDMADIMRVVGGLPDRQAVRDMKGSVEYLKAQPYVKKDAIGVVGFCMGGTYSYLLACDSRDIKACIVFYGRMVYKETNQTKPVSPIDRVPDLGCPL
ncbi:MAG: dienelactone hydrolase family protein, partial [Deltaproteobacteria bacterium]|nr:dienelactone hydrolase family protein [Deltaproteobacteria bacterium]